jgi:hypothetical protein
VRRQLEHRLGSPLEGKATRRHGAAQRHLAQLEVEEHQVERKAHAEGVHAAASREQEPSAGGAAVEERQPQQPGPARKRHRDAAAPEMNSRLAAEAARPAVPVLPHEAYNPGVPSCAPGCKRSFRQDRAHTVAVGMGEDEEVEKATRRGNYDSGSDYVLEYGELRFSFNEQDFAERVEQAAVKLDFVEGGLGVEELHDLLELAVNGEISEPISSLGEHINEHWTELVGPASRSLVHWLRRLVFRGAWLDQRVKEGELDVVFDPATQAFGYVQPERDDEPIELSREPSWARLAYRP